MVDQSLGRSSNHWPGVIGTVEERPGPEGDRGLDGPAGQCRWHRRSVSLRRFEHRPPQASNVVEECRPSNAAIVDLAHRRLVRRREGKRIAVPRRPRCFVNIDQYRDLGCRHALVTSRPMSAWHDRLKRFVPQEVGGQMVPFDLGLFNPGDRQVEAPFGHSQYLRVRGKDPFVDTDPRVRYCRSLGRQPADVAQS